jgi:UDP-glucose 4-epimerase
MSQRRNLILGGLGFIGHNLVNRLLDAGEVVHVIDINIHAQTWNLEKVYQDNPRFSVENYDCADIKKLVVSIINTKPDRVFHFAANSDISKSGEITNDFSNTLLTTLALCEVIRLGVNIPTLLFASSSAIYGDLPATMSVETSHICIPSNAYGWTKRASELALIGACKQRDTFLVIARFPNVVGPHLTHGLLFDIIRKKQRGDKVIQILGDGSQKKPFIHVDNLLDILIQKSEVKTANEIIFNIASLDQITVKEIVTIFEKEIQGAITFLYQEQREGWPGDIPEYAFDLEESKAVGTLTSVTSAQAITRSIKENLQMDTP